MHLAAAVLTPRGNGKKYCIDSAAKRLAPVVHNHMINAEDIFVV